MSLLNKYVQKYGNYDQVKRLQKSKDWMPQTPSSAEKESNVAEAHRYMDSLTDDDKKRIEEESPLGKSLGMQNTVTLPFGFGKDNAQRNKEYQTYKAAEDILKNEAYEKKREDVVRRNGSYAYKTMKDYIGLADQVRDARKGKNNVGSIGLKEIRDLSDQAADIKKTLEKMGITGKDFDVYEQYVREYKDIEDTQAMEKKIASDIGMKPVSKGIGYTAADVFVSPITGIKASMESLRRPFYADPSAPVNTYSDLYRLQNASEAVEQSVSNQIDGKFGKFVYGAGVSTLKSAEAMAIGNYLSGALGIDAASKLGQLTTLPMFGASAFASTLADAQKKGYSAELATEKALASGVAEMLFEELSLDKAWGTIRNAQAGKGGFAKRILDVFMGAGIEGSEEIFTDLANHIADNFISGDFSDYQSGIRMRVEAGQSLDQATKEAKKEFIAQLVESGLAGAASGGFMNVGAATVGSINYHNTAKNINANTELKREVVESAKGLKDTTAAEIANKKIEEITENDMVEILHSMEEVTEKSAHDIAKESLVRMGESEEEAEKKASAIVEAVSEENPTEEQEAKNTKLVEDEKTAEAYADVLKNRVAQNALSDVYENNQKVKQRRSGGITAISNGNQIKVYDFADVNKGIVNTSVGAMSLDNVQMGENERRLFKTAYVFDNNNASNAYVNEYKGQNVADYSTAAMRAYTVGASGASFESFLNDPRNASVIASVDNNAFLQEMYFHGQNTIKKEDVAKVSKSAKAEAKATTQSDLQNVFNEVAKVFNINISETATGEESGAFIPASLKLTLNQNESKNLYQTLHHELMEYSKAYAPKEYNELKSAIMDFATQKLGSPKVKMHLDIYRDTYRGFGAKTGNEAEAKKTLADATDEYVNDFVAMVMNTDEGVNQFVNYLADNSDLTEQQKTGIIQSLKDFIQKLIDSIKAYIAKHKGMNLGASDAKALTEYTEELAKIRDEIETVWNQARKEVATQIKKTVNVVTEDYTEEKNKEDKFSLNTTIEATDDLMALHNVSQEQLLKTIELGGFACPSIAIKKKYMPHIPYGDCTVVFGKATIDPNWNKNNNVYSGDAWTPVFPHVDLKVNRKIQEKIYNKIESLFGGRNKMSEFGYPSLLDYENMMDRLNRGASPVEMYSGDKMLQYAFLKDTERAFEIPQKEKQWMQDVSNKTLINLVKKLGNDFITKVHEEGWSWFKEHVEETDNILKQLNEEYIDANKDIIKKIQNDTKKPEKVRLNLAWNFNNRFTDKETGHFLWRDWHWLTDALYSAMKYGITSETDTKKRDEMLDDIMWPADEEQKTKIRGEYTDWLNKLFDGIIEKEGIRNNLDLFTPSGNRRTWDALHYEVTLENVVKAMKSQNQQGADNTMIGPQEIWGVATRKYSSIKDMRNDMARLIHQDEEERSELRAKYAERLAEIANEIKDPNESNSFIAMDVAGTAIVDSLRGAKTLESVNHRLKEYTELKIKPNTAAEVLELYNNILNMPTDYFEAKPARAVDLNEIAYVVVPSDAESKLIKALDNHSIKHYEYEKGNDGDRVRVVNEYANKESETVFSINVDSEGKTLTEDQAEYFKDSKIRDVEGRLIRMYHGTDNGNFTVFDSKHSDDKLSLFFTDNKTVAKSYSWNEPKRFDDKDKISKNVYYETYLNVKNPLRIDAQGRYWNRLQAQKLGYDYGGISVVDVTFQRQEDGKYNVISDYIDKNGLWDREELSKYFGKKFLNILDNCPNEATFPNLVVYRGNNVFPNDTRTAAMLAKYGGYDGVVIDNVKDGAGGFGRPKQVASKVVIVFDSNQVKSVDNEHPTDNEDIRYSLNVDSEGKELTSEQVEFFKDSKARDEEGRLQIFYHGTRTEGFTVFDNQYSDDGLSFFFTTEKDVAESYSGNLLTDLNERMWAENDTINWEEIFIEDKTDGKVKYMQTYKTVKEFDNAYEAAKWWCEENGIPMDVFADDMKRDLFKVYLNAKKPLVIDAQGEYWDTIEWDVPGSDEMANIHSRIIAYEKKERANEKITREETVQYDKDVAAYEKMEKEANSYGDLSTTRGIAKYAKAHGYDSVIIHNVVDTGGKNIFANEKESTVCIMFDPYSIKLTSNTKPTTDSKDVRYSLEVEDWDKLFSEMTEVKESNRILAEGLKSIDNVKLNKKITDKIASEIKSEYKSRIDKKVLSESLEKVFSYMLDTGSPSYGDLAEIMREVAMPVIEQATEVMAEEKRMYDTFKEKMKGYRIKLNAKQKAEVAQTFGSYYAFKNALFGNVVFSESGSELDSIWQSVVEASDGMLDIGTSDANQPMALYEFIQGLKPSYRNIYGADQEEAAYDVALSIFRKFLLEQEYENNPKLRQEALKLNEAHQKYRKTLKQNSDKRIKEAMDEIKIERQINIKRLIREINELNEEESNVIKGSIEQAFIVKQKEQYERRLKALREYKNEQMDKKLAELRLKQRDSQTKRIQSRQITQAKAKIRKNIEKLNSMLAHGTEKRHVPINMVRATIEMLEAIDINTGNSKSLAKYLEKMDNIYTGLKGAEAYAFDYDARTAETIKTLKKLFDGRNYTMLTLDELNQVVDITKQLVKQIENANKIMLDKKKLDAIEFSKQAIKEVREAKGKDNKFMTALDKYLTPHLNAYREFRKISGYTDGAIMELYKDLDKGQLKQLQVMKDINALFDDVLKNTKEVKAFTSTDEKDLVDSGLRDEKDNPVMITKAQRMALIMSSYNERNMEHITFGGVKVPDVKQKKREDALSKGKTYWYESPVEIRDAIYSEDADKLRLITDRASMKVKELEKGLSPWEKEFLDKVKEMFWHKTGSWINKTSLELKGYALARVNNYFPIVSDKNFVNQDVGGLVQDGTLEGWGNLKERKFGRNAIVLEDITDTILRQTNDVAKYVGLVVPIRNLNVAWNTNVYDVTTATRHTLKEAMDVWGANNKKYIENLIKDMTSRRDGGDPTFLDALRGRFAGAVLTLNPSVAIKQTASYFTAGAIVGNKTLAKTVKDIGKGFITKKGIPELEAINPLLWYRNQGNATQELADMKKTGLGKNLPTWMQKALNWVEFMDTGTVRTLEYAAKNYVDDHYIGANKLEGEEYWQKVSEVFTKIVEETQPNYTPLQQADIIRNPNKAMKMLVMFKTQPLQNFGVLYDSIGELKAKMVAKDQEGIKSAKKKVARAVVSQIQSAMTFSMMTILADLLLHKYYKYKDDDDKFSWDKVLAKFGAGITDSFWGMLLFGQDLYKAVDSFINGEQVNGLNVSYLENIANFANAIQKLYQESQKRLEAITEEDKQRYDNGIIIDTGNVINYFGQVVGLPTGNIKNMAESLILYSMDVRDGKIGENEFSRDVDTQNQRMYDALVANDSERYHKLFDEAVLKKTENGTDQDKAEESVESGIKKLIQKGYDSGELTFDEAYTILTKEMGMDETDAYFKLDEWLYKSEGNDSYSRYSRVMDAIDKAISSDDRKDMLTEIKKLMDQGVEAKNIQSQITKEYKAKYLELKARKKSATLKSILISAYMATGLSRDDAEKRIDKWK